MDFGQIGYSTSGTTLPSVTSSRREARASQTPDILGSDALASLRGGQDIGEFEMP